MSANNEPQIRTINHDHIAVITSFGTHIIVHRSKRSNFRKITFKLKIQLLVLTENLANQLGLLIPLWAGGVVTGEVKVTKWSTRSGHDLLELLLVVSLAVVVPLGVVISVGGVELRPLGAVSDEVGGVTALKATPRWSPPLHAELVQGVELSCQQGDLVIGDALVLLIRSCGQRR
jgi:hypothetical protein